MVFKSIKSIIRKYFILFFVLIVFILIYSTGINFNDIFNVISKLKVWQILFLLFGFLIISSFYVFNRKVLLKSLGVNPGFKNLCLIHFSSMAAHYSTPVKIGFPFAIYLLKKFENIPYATSTTMIFVELAAGTGLCGIIAAIGTIQFLSHNTFAMIKGILFFIFMFIIALFAVNFIIKKGNKNNKIIKFINDIYASFKVLTPFKIGKYVLFVFINHVLGSLIIVLIVSFLSSSIGLWQAVVASSISFFLGSISFIPMGLGVSDASLLFLLMHFGVSKEVGITVITIQRFLFTGLTYIIGLLTGSFLGLQNIHINKENQ